MVLTHFWKQHSSVIKGVRFKLPLCCHYWHTC